MKIFYKNAYLQAKESLEFMENSYDILSQDFAKVMKSNQEKIKKIEKQDEELELLYKHITLKINAVKELEDKVKTFRGAKGGLTKQNNVLLNLISQLKEENREQKEVIENLQKKLTEALSDKYVKVELPPDKPRKTKVMGIRRGVAKNETKKILKEKSEIREEDLGKELKK